MSGYRHPGFFEAIGQGFYRMWRAGGDKELFGYPMYGSAAEFVVDFLDGFLSEPEEPDPLFHPASFQEAALLLESPNVELFLGQPIDQPVDLNDLPLITNQQLPSTLTAPLGWLIGIILTWVPVIVLWVILLGYCCSWCCAQCCMGCAKCCHCYCRCCRNRRPICTCGCYDENGPNKCCKYCTKIAWTVLTAGYIFGGVIATIAAFRIPSLFNKVPTELAKLPNILPDLVSSVSTELKDGLPKALEPLTNIASTLDAKTSSTISAVEKVLEPVTALTGGIDKAIMTLANADQSNYGFEYDNLETYLYNLKGLKFSADVTMSDTVAGDFTLSNIYCSDEIASVIDLDGSAIKDSYDTLAQMHGVTSTEYEQSIKDAADTLINFSDGLTTTYSSDIDDAKAKISQFTWPRSLAADTYKSSFTTSTVGYTSREAFLTGARVAAALYEYRQTGSTRKLIEALRPQIAGVDSEAETFEIISPADYNAVMNAEDPANYVTSSTISTDCSPLSNAAQQATIDPSLTEPLNFINDNFRFGDMFGSSQTIIDNVNTVLDELTETLEDMTSSLGSFDLNEIFASAMWGIIQSVVSAVGYTLAAFQLAIILLYVIMLIQNWCCSIDTCICIQIGISFTYYVLFGLIFVFFCFLAILTQDIQDALYSDKPNRGLFPTLQDSGSMSTLLDFIGMDENTTMAGVKGDDIVNSLLFILQGPDYRKDQEGIAPLTNPLTGLIDSLLLNGLGELGISGMIQDGLGSDATIAPSFLSLIDDAETEMMAGFSSMFDALVDEDSAKGKLTHNYLGRALYNVIDLIGLDTVNVLMLFYFSFQLSFILFIPHTILMSIGRTHWPPYDKEADDPEYCDDSEDEEMQGTDDNKPGQPGQPSPYPHKAIPHKDTPHRATSLPHPVRIHRRKDYGQGYNQPYDPSQPPVVSGQTAVASTYDTDLEPKTDGAP
ncbi:hypothetical protein BLNAU_14607 [Blattamonas nauphoetae]|uniref:Uncharacterized protein n=1 Tax=Blattamonas nauphoetae TaxID=2049346 RepID=A0ABQ9XGE4_9EUKA|nr:hypothetical protein BLNAU_14607 [Blattamonas nauphoetae]